MRIVLFTLSLTLAACGQQNQQPSKEVSDWAKQGDAAAPQSSSSPEVVGYSVMMGGGQYVLYRTHDGALEYCYYQPDGSLTRCAVLQTGSPEFH